MLLLRSLIGRGRRPNMLVICADSELPPTFEWVRDQLGPPFSVCVVPGPLELPAGGAGTFFLHDIAALTEAQQITLYDWLNTRGRQAQVVSMTGSQILPLVESGRFHEGLFYRLNTITSVAGSA